MKKIVFVITDLGMGGAENQVVNLADQFAARGNGVTIAYILEPVIVKATNNNVNLVWLGGDKNTFGMLKALQCLIVLIKNTKPDVVHSHMFHANMLSRGSRLFAKIPCLICTAHSSNEGGRLRMLGYRLTNWLSDVFTNVSEDAVKAFERKKAVAAGKMLAISNGINTDFFKYSSAARQSLRNTLHLGEEKVFIAIGRFHEAKDYPNLLEAFVVVVQKNPNVHLLIVGDGELRPQIEAQIHELDVKESVSLLGIRRDIPELISASDIFVLSSAWEGFGLVIAEAMACESIVIGTDSGGVSNIVGDAGFIVPPRNPQALANAMLSVSQFDDSRVQTLGKAARQRILANFSLDTIVTKWQQMYRLNDRQLP